MRSAVSYAAGGLAAALVMGFVPIPVPAGDAAPRFSAAEIPQFTVDRTRKGDREPQRALSRPVRTIAAVEVVGMEYPTIVYRGSDGEVLFHADPARRTTAVAKETVVPEITIRPLPRTASEPVRHVPQPTRAPGLKFGCDPAFSPLTVPAEANTISRCLAGLATWHIAAID